MKHTYTEAQLQSAIDVACREISESPNRPSSDALVLTEKGWGHEWLKETPARLDLIKSALAALPEPEPPTVDGKTPGQVYQNMLNKSNPVKYYEWCELPKSLQVEIEAAASAVLAAFGNQSQPAEIPWTEWHGGECPLKDEEVEEWEIKFRVGGITAPKNKPSQWTWTHVTDGMTDIIAYRVLKWREGFGPSGLIAEHKALTADQWAEWWQAEADARNVQFKELQDWKAKYEEAEKNLRAKFEPEVRATEERAEQAEKSAQAFAQIAHNQQERAEKAEAELDEAHSQLDDLGFPRGNGEDSFTLKGRLATVQAIKSSLSLLRPIAEAGPVPEGCVRVYGWLSYQGRYNLSTISTSEDTHFADIRLTAPAENPDPYAELKAAHAAGKVIQALNRERGNIWQDCPSPAFEGGTDYRIKPEPETFETPGKTWTKHTPGDAMPCDGERLVTCLFADGDEWETKVLAREVRWSKRSDVGDIIGWRYADEPTLEPLETEPTTANANPVEDMALGGQMYWRDLARQLADVWWKCHNVGASLQHGDIDTDVSFSVCCELHGGKVFHADTPLNAWLKAEKWLMSPDRENFPTACLQPA